MRVHDFMFSQFDARRLNHGIKVPVKKKESSVNKTFEKCTSYCGINLPGLWCCDTVFPGLWPGASGQKSVPRSCSSGPHYTGHRSGSQSQSHYPCSPAEWSRSQIPQSLHPQPPPSKCSDQGKNGQRYL